MKSLIGALILFLSPAVLHGQEMIQPSPIEPGDARLAMIRPIAERIVTGDLDGAQKTADPHVGQASRTEFATQLKQVLATFGKDHTITGYMNGRGRNVLVTLRNGADGGSAGFVITLDPDSDRITGVMQVIVQRGGA